MYGGSFDERDNRYLEQGVRLTEAKIRNSIDTRDRAMEQLHEKEREIRQREETIARLDSAIAEKVHNWTFYVNMPNLGFFRSSDASISSTSLTSDEAPAQQ